MNFVLFFILSMCVLSVIASRLFNILTPISQIFLTIFYVHTCWQNSLSEILHICQKESFVKKAALLLLGHRLNWEKPLVCCIHSGDFASLYQSSNVILCPQTFFQRDYIGRTWYFHLQSASVVPCCSWFRQLVLIPHEFIQIIEDLRILHFFLSFISFRSLA